MILPSGPAAFDAVGSAGGLFSPLLVLWDIDHTLIDSGTVARRAYTEAFHKATGRPPEGSWRFDGRTELAAATEALQAHGLDPSSGDLLRRFIDLIVEESQRLAAAMAADGRVLPGAPQALAAVGSAPGVAQSVLTGNLYPVAVLKMEVFGLAEAVDFRIGAYGDDDYDRTDLPPHAFARAEQVLGRRHTGADTVIVGDTLRDVATAQAVGARAVAVATGTAGAEALWAAGADVVLPDLSDTNAVLEAIMCRQTGATAAPTRSVRSASTSEAVTGSRSAKLIGPPGASDEAAAPAR